MLPGYRVVKGNPAGRLFLPGAALLALALGGCALASQTQEFRYGGSELIIDRAGIAEPSGIAYHAGRGTLFVVGDEGDLIEIRPDGTVLQEQTFVLDSDDFEGITVDPQSGWLYVLVETPARIIEVDPEGLAVRRQLDIDPLYNERRAIPLDKQGVEGIALVPGNRGSEGGKLYVALRVDRDEGSSDLRSPLYVLELPAATAEPVKLTLPIDNIVYTPLTGISDLMFDTITGHLLALSADDGLLAELTLAGRTIRTYRGLPGSHQEGLALDAEGRLYVALDPGGVLRIEWSR